MLQRKWYEGLPDWVCETKWRRFSFLTYLFLWFIGWTPACLLFMFKVRLFVLPHTENWPVEFRYQFHAVEVSWKNVNRSLV